MYIAYNLSSKFRNEAKDREKACRYHVVISSNNIRKLYELETV